MTTRRVRLEYSAASVVISLILSGILGSWYVSRQLEQQAQAQREGDIALCELVKAVIQVPPDPNTAAPSTEFGRQLAESQALVQGRLTNLQQKLECP